MFSRLLTNLQHDFTSGSFSLLKRFAVSNKLLPSSYGFTRKSREWKKFRNIFCNIFFVITEYDLVGSPLSVGVCTISPCLSVCLSVRLSICLSVHSQKPLIRFLNFLYNARGQLQKTDRVGFLMKTLIWWYLVTRDQKWRKMRFRNFDKNFHFVFLKKFENERLWCYLFSNSNSLSSKILVLDLLP